MKHVSILPLYDATLTSIDSSHQLFVDELKRRSETRVQANPEFRYVMEDMERLRRRLDEMLPSVRPCGHLLLVHQGHASDRHDQNDGTGEDTGR